MQEFVYGLGGYCENCDPSHKHPLNNLIEVIEYPDQPAVSDMEQVATLLQELPNESLQTLKTILENKLLG